MSGAVHVEALRGSPLLEELPDDALARLAAYGEEVDLPRGATLLTEGSDPDAMYLLLEGELETLKRVGDDEVLIGSVDAGELVGELGLLHRRPRSAGLRASRPSRLLRVPAEALDELLAHSGSARALLATATRRLESQGLLVRQHGRMAALGNLTAGLLHELNNPAAAVQRAGQRLGPAVEAVTQAERTLAPSASAGLWDRLADLLADLARPGEPAPDALARADAEERWLGWLRTREVSRPWELAGSLAAAGADPGDLTPVTDELPPATLAAAVRWLAARLELGRLVDEAGTGARRVSEIVGAVKSYAHHGEAPTQDVDIHAGLESALTLLGHKIPPAVEIVRAYAPDLPLVEGYPGDLNVVWTNLIDNAVDAVGETGKVRLATRADSDMVVVEISDDGPGIPPQLVDRLFDPFFTTKAVGEGTGLGLATSHAIVNQRHHGRLEIRSEPGRTTATVVLPRRRQPAQPTTRQEHPTGA